MSGDYYTYGDHLIRYINAESLCCTPVTKIILDVNSNCKLKFKKFLKKQSTEQCRMCTFCTKEDKNIYSYLVV